MKMIPTSQIMSRQLLLLMLLFLSIAAKSDDQITATFNDDTTKIFTLDYCKLFVSTNSSLDEESAIVSVEIENTDESHNLVIFGQAYPEKTLKKAAIRFDKNYGGSKGSRTIEAYPPVKGYISIDPQGKWTLPTLSIQNGEKQTIRLPLYIAIIKKKNKLFSWSKEKSELLLAEKRVVEVIIEFIAKPKVDDDYVRLYKATDSIANVIKSLSFCPNPKHSPNLEKQERPYRNRVSEITTQIDSILKTRKFIPDSVWQQYISLKEQLNVVFTDSEHDCGKHYRKHIERIRHKCKYCDLSLQDIYQRLDRYYRKIDISHSNRDNVKKSVLPEVELLYRCCTDPNCVQHAKKWRSSSLRQKIINYYKRIQQM